MKPTDKTFVLAYEKGLKSSSLITQCDIHKFIRETRGVHIEVHRNASGYYWSMCMSDGGTNLGWSGHTGPNLGCVWDSYEEALEAAMNCQLHYDLPKDTTVIGHWSNYVKFMLKEVIKINKQCK